MKRFLIVFFVLASFLFFPASVFAYYTNMPASVVVGQSDFTSSGSANQGGSPGANTINSPQGVYFDKASGKLIVSDTANNRVLIFNSLPASNNAEANVVIGQANFTSNSVNQGGSVAANTLNAPTGVVVVNGSLFIADLSNNRVLIFRSIPTVNNASADLVLGQADFVSNTKNECNCNTPAANTLFSPTNIASDGQKLFISDQSNERVLIWNSIPASNNVSANVVLGQTDFTTRATNQGGIGANTFATPVGLLVAENKLLVGDVSNFRVLVWNSIPTTNKAPADVVIGQPNFTSNGGIAFPFNTRRPYSFAYDGIRLFIAHDFSSLVSVRNNGIPTVNYNASDISIGNSEAELSNDNFGEPRSITLAENKLIVADLDDSRILIFNNILSAPQLNLTTPPTTNSDGTYHLVGNVLLGNRGTYSMQKVEASINGSGYGNVTSLDGGRDNGNNQTLYEFTENFSPWSNNGTKENWSGNGYTISIRAQSFNAETDTQFYFQPFTLTSVSSNTYKLSVPKNKWQNLKDNLDSFSVSYSKDKKVWTALPESVKPTDNMFDANTGILTLTTTKQIPTGNYFVKIVAKDKQSHSQDSNTLTTNSNGVISYAPYLILTNSWFPIQINSITGSNIGMLSNYFPLTKTSFVTNTLNPTISGIAFSGSTVHVLVTNPTTLKQNTYTTVTKPNSTFSITPTISSGSVLDVWVSLNGLYSEIPAFKLNIF